MAVGRDTSRAAGEREGAMGGPLHRVDARTASAADLRRLDDGESIVVLTNVLEGFGHQAWLQRVMDGLGGREVLCRRTHAGSTESLRCLLGEMWGERAPGSSHEDSIITITIAITITITIMINYEY